MSASTVPDPTGMDDDALIAHAADHLELPLIKVGPIATPVGHPDHYPHLADYLACEGITAEDAS